MGGGVLPEVFLNNGRERMRSVDTVNNVYLLTKLRFILRNFII